MKDFKIHFKINLINKTLKSDSLRENNDRNIPRVHGDHSTFVSPFCSLFKMKLLLVLERIEHPIIMITIKTKHL